MVPNALVLVADRLGSAYLGPYGNTWIETPAWNRLAARATLYETALIDAPNLANLYESYWHGRHAIAATTGVETPSLAKLLSDQDVQTWLITDERLVAEQTEAQEFSQRVVLPPGGSDPATSIEGTQLARLFATALEVLQQAQPPFLIWVHAQAMQAPWDAPYELRVPFAEEEDPDPPPFTDPPDLWLDSGYDPDWLLGVQHAYAGQVTALDSCLEVLLDAIWSSNLNTSTALLATASRGFPIGEHRYVGRSDYPLFEELIHVPWINCWPNSVGALRRMHQMVQPPDMYATLLNWFGVEVPLQVWGRSLHEIDVPPSPDQLVACSVHEQQHVLRVPGWLGRWDADDAVELFVKPDDRWEFNEISSRCMQVVEQLNELRTVFQTAARAYDRQQIPALAESLLQGGM